jgi:hypothetical protein
MSAKRWDTSTETDLLLKWTSRDMLRHNAIGRQAPEGGHLIA